MLNARGNAPLAVMCAVATSLVTGGCETGSEGTSGSPSATCTRLGQDEGPGWEIQASVLSDQGRRLTYERRFVGPLDLEGSFILRTVVAVDGDVLMSVDVAGDPERYEISVDYGQVIPGLSTATALVEDGLLTGSIDGRELEPVAIDEASVDTARFEDGLDAPADDLDPDIRAAMPSLTEAAADAACEIEGSEVGSGGAASQSVASRDIRSSSASDEALRAKGDTGHDSNPTASAGCAACWGGCSGAAAGCIAGVSVACAATTVFYAICEAAAVAGCLGAYVGCVAGCNADGGPCCPVSCGNVACCEDGETCLNSQTGLCCSPGTSVCVGEECCATSEICIDSGPNAGTCCEPENRCGNACCGPADTCLQAVSLCCAPSQTPCINKCCDTEGCIENGPNAGTCCEPERICGDTCCTAELYSGCIEALSLCCPFASPPCGTICCNLGEQCLPGNNCCPDERVCAGGVCCAEGSGCNLDTNTCVECPAPNMRYCQEAGTCCPNTQVCTPVANVCCPVDRPAYCGFPLMCRRAEECIL